MRIHFQSSGLDLRFFSLISIFVAVLSHALLLPAAIIGTNIPAKPLTAERIGSLPPASQPAWRKYLERSSRQMQADQAFLAKELRQHNLQKPITPPQGNCRMVRPGGWLAHRGHHLFIPDAGGGLEEESGYVVAPPRPG